MSRGLGKMQRAILDALGDAEWHDLREVSKLLRADAEGRSFPSSFSRAIRTLETRRAIETGRSTGLGRGQRRWARIPVKATLPHLT
jgi:hypothetical protein